MVPSSGMNDLGCSEKTWRLIVSETDNELRKRALRNYLRILPGLCRPGFSHVPGKQLTLGVGGETRLCAGAGCSVQQGAGRGVSHAEIAVWARR